MRTAASASKCRVRSAADHQVAVAVLTQPLDAVLGGDAAVHHHQGGARGVERIEHLGQRVMFAHVAGEDLRATHEAAGVEHQPQGEEWTIGAFFLGVSASVPWVVRPPRLRSRY